MSLKKANIIPRDPTVGVSKFSPLFMIQMQLSLFNVENFLYLPLTLLQYVPILHIPFDFRQEVRG